MSSYNHQYTVRLQDIDAAGVIFYGQLFTIAHGAWEQVLADNGCSLAQLIKTGEYALPVVRAEAEFLRPIQHGDTLNIQVSVSKIDDSSFTCLMAMTIGEASERPRLAASVTQVHVCIDCKTAASISIPPHIRSTLTQLSA